jgi:hypothetical protein
VTSGVWERNAMPPEIVASRPLLIGGASARRFFLPRITQQMQSIVSPRDLVAAAATLAGIIAWAALFALVAYPE